MSPRNVCHPSFPVTCDHMSPPPALHRKTQSNLEKELHYGSSLDRLVFILSMRGGGGDGVRSV